MHQWMITVKDPDGFEATVMVSASLMDEPGFPCAQSVLGVARRKINEQRQAATIQAAKSAFTGGL